MLEWALQCLSLVYDFSSQHSAQVLELLFSLLACLFLSTPLLFLLPFDLLLDESLLALLLAFVGLLEHMGVLSLGLHQSLFHHSI